MASLEPVTARMGAQAEAPDWGDRLATAALDALPLHVAILDPGGTIIRVNRAWRTFAEANGKGASHLNEGADYFAVCAAAHGPGSEDARAFAEGLRSLLQGGQTEFRLEYPCHAPDQQRWFEGSATRFPGGDRQGCILVAHADITQRRLAEADLTRREAELAESQEIAQVGSWRAVFSEAGEQWWGSAELYRIYGYPAGKVITARTGIDMMHPDDREPALASWTAALKGLGPAEWEHRIVVAGQVKWLRVMVKFQFDREGRLAEAAGTLQDITRRRLAADLLRASEARLRSVLDHSRDGIYRLDLQRNRYDYVSPSAEALTGYTAEELMAMAPETVLAMIHPEDLPAFQAALGDLDTLGHAELEYRQRNRDGSYRWFSNHLSQTRDAAGRALHRDGILRDITSLKRMVEDLRRVMREQEIILENANVGISLIVDRRQVWLNGWVADKFQYPLAEMQGCTTRKFYRTEEAYERFGREAYPALARGEAYESVQELLRRDGQPLWIRYHGKAINPRDLGQGTLWILTDVTRQHLEEDQLRASEAQFRAMFESHSAMMLLVDPGDGRIFDANAASAGFYGYSRDQLRGMNIGEINQLPPPGWLNEMESAVHSRKNIFHFPHRLADGQVRSVEVHSSPTRVGDRTLLFSIIHDITERRQAERLQAHLQEELRRQAAALGNAQEDERIRVSREIHDDLGQLLTALKIEVDWMERRLEEPGLPPVLHGLIDRVVQAAGLTDALLAAVQRISMELRPSLVDQLGLEQALRHEARRLRERTALDCAVVAEGPCPALPPEAARNLFFLCREALTNVLRHARAARVGIGWRQEGGMAVFTVADDGIGMGAGVLAQSPAVGLSGMRERADLCGGTLTFEPVLPHGTKVTVRLPLAGPPAERIVQP